MTQRFTLPYLSSLFLLFVICLSSTVLKAQTEAEPNGSFATANPAAFATNMSGSLCSGDGDDYFRMIIPAGNKSLRLIVQSSTPTGSGGMYVYLYNKYQSQLDNKYISVSTASSTDTLDYTCFEGDTFYVRVHNWSGSTCKNYTLRVVNTNRFTLQNDAEPNDNFASAQELTFQKDTSGHLASQRYLGSASQDNDDYYRCVVPAGTKSLRLISATRTVTPGVTGGVYYYLYNKYQSQLINRYVAVGSTLLADTMDYDCFEGDTFYVRVHNWAGTCKEYRIKVDFTNHFTLKNDAEPNDNFATAQELIFQKDTTGHLASQRYIGGASQDNDDYFRCVMPPGGTKSLRLITSTRTVVPGATAGVYYYFYNKYQQQLINRYVSFGNTAVPDTLDYTCFEGDTFYVRVHNWSGTCKEYRIRAEYTNRFTVQNDAEPNDDFATAQPLQFQKDTTGHLAAQRYLGGASQDNDDYYRCVLPPGSTKSLRLTMSLRMVEPGATGGVYAYFYNKYQNQLINKYVSLNSTLKTDTLDFTCFEGDTFYVRIHNWSGACKEYRIKTDYTGNFTLQNDVEPNETRATATPIDYKQTVTGHLDAEVYGPTGRRTDNDDYYRCTLPDNGKGVRIINTTRSVEPGATGGVYYYIYNRSGSQLINKYVGTTNTAKSDTIEFNCIQPDTFYIRVHNWSGSCKEYSFRTTQSTTGPIAFDISHTRFGNNFSFMNTTRNARKFQWNFGDGTTDTTAAPVHEFKIGTYIVTLNATNVCGTRLFRDTIKIDGIEYYTPKTAGTNNGFGVFNVRTFGAGLDSNMSVTLKKGGTDYKPSRTRSPQQAEATSTFDFRSVPFGKYDVEIKLSSGLTFSYPQGFEVYRDTPGINIVTEILAPARVRTGRMNTYAVKVRNNNGRVANGVQVFIVLPRGMKNDIHKTLFKRKGKLVVKGQGFDRLTIDRDFYNNVYHGGNFDPNRDTISVDHDIVYSVIDSSTISYDIDSLFNRPYVATVYPIIVPFIPANGTHTLTFQAGTPANGNYQIASYVYPWTFRQNPMSAEALDNWHEAGMQAAAVAEVSPIPGLKQVGAAAGYIDIGSQVLFAELFDGIYGTNVADDKFYAQQGTALVGELAGELVPFKKNANDALENANSARRRLARQTESLQHENHLVLAGLQKNHPQLAKNMSERIEYLQNAIKANNGIITKQEKEDFLLRFGHWAADQGIDLTTDQIESLLFPEDIKQKPLESLASFDPNAIYGPSGAGMSHYIRRNEQLPYEVTFENVDTALVPAQIVRVEVNLDTSRYDLSRTTLGSVRIGGKLYLFEDDRKDYFRDIDLRPAKNLIVRVNAKTDTISGKLYWEFLSLDPITKNLTEDVLDGFLPPNKVSPEGEGAVTFNTRLKPGVRNNDTLSAFARIYFDENEPILTNTWSNRVDEGKPVTTLNPTPQVTSDSTFTLGLSGSDGESGFQEYRLYVKKSGDTAWSHPYMLNGLTGNKVTGTPGETYSLYVEGRDTVGIWEKKEQKAEATVTLPKVGPPLYSPGIAVYPNPAKDEVTVRAYAAQDGALRINLTNITGQVVQAYEAQQKAGSADYKINTASLESGIYFVEVLLNNDELATQKLVILR